MMLYGKIVNGQLKFNNQERYEKLINNFPEGTSIQIEIQKEINERTYKQNKALHLYYTLVSEALNKDGFDMRTFIQEGIDIMWTPYTVKEYLWKPLQQAILGKASTKQLTTSEIDMIYVPLNKTIGERTGIYVPFPSIENYYNIK